MHLKGVFFLIQRLLPLMNDGGRILNLSSGLARFALPGYAACGAKGAVEVLSRYLAQELRPRHCGIASPTSARWWALLQPATRWLNAQRNEASGGMFL